MWGGGVGCVRGYTDPLNLREQFRTLNLPDPMCDRKIDPLDLPKFAQAQRLVDQAWAERQQTT